MSPHDVSVDVDEGCIMWLLLSVLTTKSNNKVQSS